MLGWPGVGAGALLTTAELDVDQAMDCRPFSISLYSLLLFELIFAIVLAPVYASIRLLFFSRRGFFFDGNSQSSKKREGIHRQNKYGISEVYLYFV